MNKYLYTNIVEEIEEKIKNGILEDGEKLPSERVMAEQYNVSRNVVREAFKVMSEKGLVQIYSGRGAYVSIPKDNVISNKLREVISIRNSNLEEILEVRVILETAVAERAIIRASQEDIRTLEDIFNKMNNCIRDAEAFSEEDTNFHIAMAKCTGNSSLVMLINTFNSISDKSLYKINALYMDKAIRAQIEHKNMLEALKERDKKRLLAAVHAHISCLESELKFL